MQERKQKKLRCKGLRIPRPAIFLYGFLNGRFKTAGVDRGTNLLNSAYIHGHGFLYHELCRRRIAQLERDLSPVYAEADKLMAELEALPDLSPRAWGEEGESNGQLPASAAEAQSCRITARRTAQIGALRNKTIQRRREIVDRLLEIRNQTASCELSCAEELEAVAEALKSRFCTYGHGVLMKPIRVQNIPKMDCGGYMENYCVEHAPLKQKLGSILDREETRDV